MSDVQKKKQFQNNFDLNPELKSLQREKNNKNHFLVISYHDIKADFIK